MPAPTRSYLVMAVVTDAERTAAASYTAAPRSLAALVGPSLACAMLGGTVLIWPFLIGWVLKNRP